MKYFTKQAMTMFRTDGTHLDEGISKKERKNLKPAIKSMTRHVQSMGAGPVDSMDNLPEMAPALKHVYAAEDDFIKTTRADRSERVFKEAKKILEQRTTSQYNDGNARYVLGLAHDAKDLDRYGANGAGPRAFKLVNMQPKNMPTDFTRGPDIQGIFHGLIQKAKKLKKLKI